MIRFRGELIMALTAVPMTYAFEPFQARPISLRFAFSVFMTMYSLHTLFVDGCFQLYSP